MLIIFDLRDCHVCMATHRRSKESGGSQEVEGNVGSKHRLGGTKCARVKVGVIGWMKWMVDVM